MIRFARGVALLAVGSVAAAGAAYAERQISVGVGGGTVGGSVEAEFKISDILQVRGGYNYLSFSGDDTYDRIAYKGDLDFSTVGAFLDLHPFANAWMISGALYHGDKRLKLSATPSGNVQVGDVTYTPSQVGTLNMRADLKKTAPFVGLGWDSTFHSKGPIGLKFVVGAMFTGKPSVGLASAGGTLSSNSAFQAELRKEEQKIRSDADNLKVYPVAEAGVTFAF